MMARMLIDDEAMSYYLSEAEREQKAWMDEFKVRQYLHLSIASPRSQAMISGVTEERDETWWERFSKSLYERTMARLRP